MHFHARKSGWDRNPSRHLHCHFFVSFPMKTLAFWHEYPGSQPEPEKPKDFDGATVMIWTFVFCLLIQIIIQPPNRRF
jgi:hypothetical protein